MSEQMSFTFFRSYYEAARELPEAQRFALYEAIMQTMFEGETPDLQGVVKAMFLLIAPVLAKSAARSLSGSVGRGLYPPQQVCELVGDPGAPAAIERGSNKDQTRIKTESNADQNRTEEEEEKEEEKDITPLGPPTGGQIPDSRYQIPDTRPQIPDVGATIGRPLQAAGYKSQDHRDTRASAAKRSDTRKPRSRASPKYNPAAHGYAQHGYSNADVAHLVREL